LLKEAALVKGELVRGIAGASVIYPPDLCPNPPSESRTSRLRFGKFVDQLEIFTAPRLDPNDGLDARPFRLRNYNGRLQRPTLEIRIDVRRELLREVSKNCLDVKPVGWVAVEIVDFCWCRPWPSAACVQQKVERFEDRTLPGVVRADKYGPS
jgi:hypothetical protein